MDLHISTSSQALRDDLLAANFPGVQQFELLRKSFDPDRLFHVVLEHVDSLATGLIGAWLYDAIKKHRSHKTEIQGRDAPQSEAEIRVAIEVAVQESEDDEPGQD